MQLPEGTRIEQFEIREILGKGGMGEVYLARDTKLNRNAAIKLLSSEIGDDPEKLKRFVQEAQAASALNHPNIVTVYDIGDFDGLRYIALEYIDGRSLTEHLLSGSLTLSDALKIAVQMASALDSAHSAGIVHRDIKPDNVMIRGDGIAKILDFGIAKLTEKPHREPGPEDRTELKVNTSPGMILGTASYMSPEQGKGGSVDSRSDVFSLGIVIYEMISGRLPFEGESAMEMIGSILKDEPRPLPESVPQELRRIVTKCLRKDPDQRYQTMKGLLADLNQLPEAAGGGAKTDPAPRPEGAEQQTRMIEATTSERPDEATNITSQHSRAPWLYVAGAGVLATVAIFVVWYFFFAFSGGPAAFSSVVTEEIRSGSLLGRPVISPDGKFVAFSSKTDGDGEDQIFVRQMETGEETSIFKRKADLRVDAYSPDGQYLYFSEVSDGNQYSLYRISSIGGSPKKLTEGRSLFAVNPSPDGKALVFREIVEDKGAVAFVLEPESGEKREVLELADTGALDFAVGGWTPDSARFLLVIWPELAKSAAAGEQGSTQLAVFDPREDGRSRKERIEVFHEHQWDDFHPGPLFMPDQSGVVGVARQRGGRYQFWRVSYPGGAFAPITNDSADYGLLSMSADGRKLVTASIVDLSTLWSVDLASGQTRQLSSESKSRRAYHFSTDDQGRAYYIEDSGGGSKIVSIDSEGQNRKDHFSLPSWISSARVSPDGKYIVAGIWSGEVGAERLFRFDLDGGNKTELSRVGNGGDLLPFLAPDGNVIFERRLFGVSAPTRLFSVPVAGGDETELPGLEDSAGDVNPSVSPDGRFLAYEASLQVEGSKEVRNVVRVVEYKDGRAGKKVLEFEFNPPRIRWWHDSSALILENEDDPYGNFTKVTVPGGEMSRITDFQIRADSGDLVWNSTKDKLLIMRATTISSIVLISGNSARGD